MHTYIHTYTHLNSHIRLAVGSVQTLKIEVFIFLSDRIVEVGQLDM